MEDFSVNPMKTSSDYTQIGFYSSRVLEIILKGFNL